MTAAPRILFFADAGASVGGGHVMRCLTLAEALIRAGAVCGFVATPEAETVLRAFAGSEIARWPIPADEVGPCVAAVAERARAWGAAGVVLDHYGAGLAQERTLKATGAGLLALDDLRRAHDADLVLDPTLGRTPADYTGQAALTGAAFALVRPAFAERRAGLSPEGRRRPVRRILVSLGLTDVGAITARVARALSAGLVEQTLEIVVGAAAPSLPALRAQAERDARLQVHVDVREMAALAAEADLAIGAGGSSAWERCCLGLPSLILVLAENQRINTQALAAAGAGLMLDAAVPGFDLRLVEAVDRLIDDPALRERLSRSSAALCDGLGAERAAAAVLGLAEARRIGNPQDSGAAS